MTKMEKRKGVSEVTWTRVRWFALAAVTEFSDGMRPDKKRTRVSKFGKTYIFTYFFLEFLDTPTSPLQFIVNEKWGENGDRTDYRRTVFMVNTSKENIFTCLLCDSHVHALEQFCSGFPTRSWWQHGPCSFWLWPRFQLITSFYKTIQDMNSADFYTDLEVQVVQNYFTCEIMPETSLEIVAIISEVNRKDVHGPEVTSREEYYAVPFIVMFPMSLMSAIRTSVGSEINM